MYKLLNCINILSISTNSLILALIALILILIILVIILIIKSNNNNNKKENYSFLESDKTVTIADIEIDNNDEKNDKLNSDKLKNELAHKIEMPKETAYKRQEKFDISSTTKKMQEDINNENIDLTDFEIEQEEKSIISYKELLEKVNRDKFNSNENNTLTRTKAVYDDIDENMESNEYTFNTEVIDFDAEVENVKIQKQNKIKQEKTTILNLEENDYSHDDFLKNLKTLKDNLG